MSFVSTYSWTSIRKEMKDFKCNIDKNVEFMGNDSKFNDDEEVIEEHIELEVLNNDRFEGYDTESDEEGLWKKKIRKSREHMEDGAVIEKTIFYLGQKFESSDEVKDVVKFHAIEIRRKLVFVKNDHKRIRVKCEGLVANLKVGEICSQHSILKLVKWKMWGQIPIKAVRSNLETDLKLQISEHKAYRALRRATGMMQGDYKVQYGELRDYVCELRRANHDSTMNIKVEGGTLKSETRVFKRIYICYSLMKRFNAIGRDLLGLDGSFMKEPTTCCILTAVGVDSNNGIYPVAYAIVEQECGASWTWFLECLGDDLDLANNSNFTFISDR
ncbi:uncharacterized protein [Rutidosis leptorrhynchoides]|uniref:uncharacterized protein n=1 Tax=Rutidosis leptorrhynchoides TaxID=125765 RepID=UPI003A99E764